MRMNMNPVRPARFRLVAALTLFLLPTLSAWALQDTKRPPTEDLLPETTVLYFQAADLPQLIEDMDDTNFGRMMQDEKLAPLMGELWAQAKDAWRDLSEREDIGIEIDDLMKLPHGEVCFAAVAPRRKDMQFAFFIDVDEEADTAERLLARGRELAERDGATFEEEAVEEITYTTIQGDGDAPPMTLFRKDGTVVVTSSRELSDEIVTRWKGGQVDKVRPLKENRKFATIMNRCRGTKEQPPEMRFFWDPIEFFKSVTRGDAGSQVAIGFLPVLGLDGLLAVGGSAILNEGEFQSVNRFHILLSNPRAGIIEMMALKPADYKPAPWVPENCSNYIATSWDVDRMYSELTKIVDTFTAEGTFEAQVQENVNDELEINLKDDLIGALNGNFTWVTWNEPPMRVNSQSNGIGLGLKDVDKAEMVIRKIIDRINRDADEPRMVEETHKGVTVWRFDNSEIEEQFRMQREEGRTSVSLRAPSPTLAIVGEWLIFGDSTRFVHNAIETDRGDQFRLAENADFERITGKMTKLLKSDMPAAVLYSRPELVFEQWLEVARGSDVKGLLDTVAAENQYADGVRRALEDHPLPEFNDLRKYFSPQGAFVLSDDTGYHLLQFETRAEDKPDVGSSGK